MSRAPHSETSHGQGRDADALKGAGSDEMATENEMNEARMWEAIKRSIQREFPGRDNAGLREQVRERAAGWDSQRVRNLAYVVALTMFGQASLERIALAVEQGLRSRAIEMLRNENPWEYREDRHGRRADILASVLTEHPDAVLVSCSDEKTGERFGKRNCRRGRCRKIGYTTYEYQLWAVWGV